jgi:hypothetical protein
MTNNYIRRIESRPLVALLFRFVLYLLVFHVPFSLLFPWGSERTLYFIFSMTLVYLPFLFWEMYARMQKQKEYNKVRNGSVLFSFLVGLHWLVMVSCWASLSNAFTLNQHIVIVIIYCLPWTVFAWIAAKVVWKSFEPPSAPRRRLTAMAVIPLISILFWLGISFYTIYFLIAARG